jgi:HEAT repeat protein
MGKSASDWLDQLRSDDDDFRTQARLKLGGLTASDAHLLRGLIEALSSPDDDRVFWSVVAIKRLGEAAESAVPQLDALLDHRTLAIRQSSARALGEIGTCDQAVLRRLVKMLRGDSEFFARADAARSLQALGRNQPDVLHALIDALADPHLSVRRAAAIALKILAPHDGEILSRLRQLCEDPRTEQTVRDQLEVAITWSNDG